VCTACVPLEVDPDDGAEEVDDDEYGDEADDQVAGVGDDGARRVHVRHDRPTQLVAVQTELLPARHPPHARTHARTPYRTDCGTDTLTTSHPANSIQLQSTDLNGLRRGVVVSGVRRMNEVKRTSDPVSIP